MKYAPSFKIVTHLPNGKTEAECMDIYVPLQTSGQQQKTSSITVHQIKSLPPDTLEHESAACASRHFPSPHTKKPVWFQQLIKKNNNNNNK